MTQAQCKKALQRVGMTFKKTEAGDFRVNFKDGDESTASYSDSLADSFDTACAMAKARQVCDGLVIDESNHVVKKTVHGKVYAIRFAVEMTKADIVASLQRDYPQARDWTPYNESDNTFIGRY